MLRFTKRFLTSSDTAGAKKTHVEQKLTDWLFEQFGAYTLTDTCSAIASVVEAFPPIDRKATITPALLGHIQVALVRWGQGLQDLAQPTRDEASHMGRELFLLILHEIHPDYVECISEGGPEEKTAVAAPDLTLKAAHLLNALEESSTYPHPYVTLPSVPSLLFPLENVETGERIWIELSPTHYGFSVNAHRRKPRTHDVATPSRETAMAGIHVDYYIAPQPMENPLTRRGTPRQRWKRQQELLQIQLFDETVGPYDEPHWVVPDDYSAFEPGPSILLVRDVRRWKAPQEDPTEADVTTHQEAHAADVLDHPAKKGDHHA
jgi:hypothetical protein